MKKARTEIFEPEVSLPNNRKTVHCPLTQILQDDAMGRNAQSCGLSWVKPGTYKPFSKDDT